MYAWIGNNANKSIRGRDGGLYVSKDRGKTPHVFNRHEWECFLIGAKNGEFDLPVI